MAREVNFHNVALERAERFFDRQRLVIGLCAAVAVALVAAIPGLLTSADSGRSVRTEAFTRVTPTTALPAVGVVSPLDSPQSPASPPQTSTTLAPAVLGAIFTRPTTTVGAKTAPAPAKSPAKAAAPSPTAAPSGATTTTVCRNSYDAACGSFRWDPDPGPNQPMTGQLTSDPPNPVAGATVTFHITASDPDATPVQICDVSYGQGEAGYVCDPLPKTDPKYCPAQHGPWTPPARQQGNLDTTDRHVYANPGTYQVSYTLGSAMGDCNNPYASGLTLTTTVVVT